MQTSEDESDGGVKQEGAVGADEAALTVNNGKRGVEDPKVRSARGRIWLFYNTLAVSARQFEKPNFPFFFFCHSYVHLFFFAAPCLQTVESQFLYRRDVKSQPRPTCHLLVFIFTVVNSGDWPVDCQAGFQKHFQNTESDL